MAKLVELRQEKSDSILILRIKGRLDHITAPEVRNQLFSMINRGDLFIAMDFKEVTYVSIAGLYLLTSLHQKIEQAHGRLVIFSISHLVTNILKITNSDAVLHVYETEKEALEHCKPS